VTSDLCLERGWRSVVFTRRGHGKASLIPFQRGAQGAGGSKSVSRQASGRDAGGTAPPSECGTSEATPLLAPDSGPRAPDGRSAAEHLCNGNLAPSRRDRDVRAEESRSSGGSAGPSTPQPAPTPPGSLQRPAQAPLSSPLLSPGAAGSPLGPSPFSPETPIPDPLAQDPLFLPGGHHASRRGGSALPPLYPHPHHPQQQQEQGQSLSDQRRQQEWHAHIQVMTRGAEQEHSSSRRAPPPSLLTCSPLSDPSTPLCLSRPRRCATRAARMRTCWGSRRSPSSATRPTWTALSGRSGKPTLRRPCCW
jgi:hypothetical protein